MTRRRMRLHRKRGQSVESVQSSPWLANEEICEVIKTGTPEEVRVARTALVSNNKRLVYMVASQWSWACEGKRGSATDRALELEDLHQHGFVGLWTAAHKFDSSQGSKFSTYAMWWIRMEISRAVYTSGVVRIPINMRASVVKFIATERTISYDQYSQESLQEIQRRMGLDDNKFLFLLHAVKVYRGGTLSLNSSNDSDGKNLESLVWKSPASGDVHLGFQGGDLDSWEAETQDTCGEIVSGVMHEASLSERENHIITRRFGLDGQAPETLEQIGARFGLTRERIRQLEVSGMAKLRNLELWTDFAEMILENPLVSPSEVQQRHLERVVTALKPTPASVEYWNQA